MAAGMDDFITKPFTQKQLAQLLGRWLPEAREQPPRQAARASPEDPASPSLIDMGVLRDISALGRPALLGALIELYLQHSPGLIVAIESAARNGQPAALAEAIHTLKSSTANLGGARLARLLKECELLLNGGKAQEAATLVQRIAAEYRDFCDALVHEKTASAA
jgi:two-component system sensor histidine kinase/response regulator